MAQYGRPKVDNVDDIMRSMHRKYHFAVKGLMATQTDLRNSILADAYINQPAHVFWRQVYNANAIKAASSPADTANSHTSPSDIANEFKHMYSGIFRAGFTTEADLNAFGCALDNSCNISE